MSSNESEWFGPLPEGRRLEQDGKPRNLMGTLYGLPRAGTDRLELARRSWPEGRERDFEELGGGFWRDKASGIEYRRLRNEPLADLDLRKSGVDVFLHVNDSLIYLRRADRPAPVGEEREVGVVGVRRGHPGERGLTPDEAMARGGWTA